MMWVYATGAVTAVGMDAPQTCAAIRAKQSGIEAVIPQAPPKDPLLAAAVPAKAALKQHTGPWLTHLMLRAMKECLQGYKGDVSRLALFASLPEPFRQHDISQDGTGQAFLVRVVQALGHGFSPHSRVLMTGHSATATALELAASLLQQGLIDAALVGGADSLLGDKDISRLSAQGRLHEQGQAFGCIPGEGAAFVLVGGGPQAFANPPLAFVQGVGQAKEADSLAVSSRYSVGIGLQAAIEQALQRAGRVEGDVSWRITDVNGERYRSWESSMLLTRQYRAWRDGLPVLHLPAFTGDMGAATLPLQLVVATHALHQGLAPGQLVVCESSSEAGLRAACLLAPVQAGGEDSRRRNRFPHGAHAPHERGMARLAVVARQVDRLPDELAWMAAHRQRLVGGHLGFKQLCEHDERMDAMLDLAYFGGQAAWDALVAGFDNTGPSGLFALFVLALESQHPPRLVQVLELAAAQKQVSAELLDAFNWVSSDVLKGVVAQMAQSSQPLARLLAVHAIASHGVAPGALLQRFMGDTDPAVLARTLQLLGEQGLVEASAAVLPHLDSGHETVRFWAARSGVLLGDRGDSLRRLAELASGLSPHADQAQDLLLRAVDVSQGRVMLAKLAQAAQDAPGKRRLIKACAAVGDPHFASWLIEQMRDPALARLAGWALTEITGVELGAMTVDRAVAEAARQMPSAELQDEPIDMDEDNDLAHPDAAKVWAWWQQNGGRFAPGERHYLGRPPTAVHCQNVLRTGTQRQRTVAACLQTLQAPGSPLFPVSAPGWRQRRVLMGVA